MEIFELDNHAVDFQNVAAYAFPSEPVNTSRVSTENAGPARHRHELLSRHLEESPVLR